MSLPRNDERPEVTDVAPTNRASSARPRTLSIGQLARVTGETVKTPRYWTDRGLLEAERGKNNYRTYDRAAPGRAAFIRNAQRLGLRLEVIDRLLGLAAESQNPCDRVENELSDHLAHVREQLVALRGLEAKLVQMLASADARPCGEGEGCCYLPPPRFC